MEQLINWMEINVESVKNAKKAREASLGLLLAKQARGVTPDPDEGLVAPFEGLPDEFTGNADPVGDACCYEQPTKKGCGLIVCCEEPKCPCHSNAE